MLHVVPRIDRSVYDWLPKSPLMLESSTGQTPQREASLRPSPCLVLSLDGGGLRHGLPSRFDLRRHSAALIPSFPSLDPQIPNASKALSGISVASLNHSTNSYYRERLP
jgi:hypothetical protein